MSILSATQKRRKTNHDQEAVAIDKGKSPMPTVANQSVQAHQGYSYEDRSGGPSTRPPLVPSHHMTQTQTQVPYNQAPINQVPINQVPINQAQNNVMNNQQPVASNGQIKKPRKRRPVRYMKLKKNTKKIISALAGADSGMSILDWMVYDKEAQSDILAAIRTMRATKKKKQSMNLILDPDNSAIAPMEINNAQGILDWSTRVEKGADSDVDCSEVNHEQESAYAWTSTSDSDYEDSDSESDESGTESERTPISKLDDFNINTIQASTPLRAPVLINGQLVDCIFDTGAGVSVMSESLAKQLQLEPTHVDEMVLVSFDDKKYRNPARVTANVPINVAGHVSHEHFWIQPPNNQKNSNFCIIGMTWFKSTRLRFE
ncbi:hypothetical protein EDC96DRAFT_260432 [Choanephora cucurbitarum]|nr:hypothetical protein EDC96DRAFT_260432 [Choanephora cucurbitarum]